jgi:hypothetical protein
VLDVCIARDRMVSYYMSSFLCRFSCDDVGRVVWGGTVSLVARLIHGDTTC